VKTHYDIRAGRILLARQTHVLRQIAIAEGYLADDHPAGERRAEDHAAD
jgi:hypothetical protein